MCVNKHQNHLDIECAVVIDENRGEVRVGGAFLNLDL